MLETLALLGAALIGAVFLAAVADHAADRRAAKAQAEYRAQLARPPDKPCPACAIAGAAIFAAVAIGLYFVA